MSVIRYIFNNMELLPDDQPRELLVSDKNDLSKYPDAEYYENTVAYYNNDSSHVRGFECSFSYAYPGYSLLNRQCKEFSIIYILDGVAYYNGFRMVKGDAVFVEPYFVHSLVYSTENAPKIYRVAWEGDITVHVAQMLRSYTSDRVYRVGFDESIETLFDSIIYNRFLGEVNVKQLAVGFTDMLMAYMTRAVLHGDSEKTVADLITRAKDAINTGYADLTVDQLASLLYVNSKYLSKVFKKYTGMTPKHYITDIKMVHAEHYLVSTEYPIQKISEIVGYNNYTNFYIAFKTKYGLAPEEYRKTYSDNQ